MLRSDIQFHGLYEVFKEVILKYSSIDPIVEFIRHNENMTYKVIEKGSEDTYLLRMHKPL